MNNPNIFEQHFNAIAESSRQESISNSKLIKGVYELSIAKRVLNQKEKELAEAEAEITILKSKNEAIKSILMKSLIERDEMMIKKTAIEANIERLNNQLKNLGNETDDILKGEEVDHVCERFSLEEQASLLNKIQDNRTKLIKNGFPLNFFA